MELFDTVPRVVHYFDENGALHSGRFLRRITKGKHKGKLIVLGGDGRRVVPKRVRSLDYDDSDK